ncbi:MAG: hypothetical protein K6G60_00320 [Lachnospiraceae bacterium]|nr:hypothetical protein [Lachnospiraceae bacterium]
MNTLLKLPRVRISNMKKDYACGTYTDSYGNTQYDFSCDPYGSAGKIDNSSSDDTVGKIGIIVTIIDWILKFI